MENAHHARLDRPEQEGPFAQNDLAELVALLEDGLGCPSSAAQPMPGLGAMALLAPNDQFFLMHQDPVLGLQHDAIAILGSVEVRDPDRSLMEQAVDIMGAKILKPMEWRPILGNGEPLSVVFHLVAALLEEGAIKADRDLQQAVLGEIGQIA